MSVATFAAKLRELREAAEMTQTALAEKCGLTRDGIAHLEQGRREPSWATVQALAKALGVDCRAFQLPDIPPPPPPINTPKGKKPTKAEKVEAEGIADAFMQEPREPATKPKGKPGRGRKKEK